MQEQLSHSCCCYCICSFSESVGLFGSIFTCGTMGTFTVTMTLSCISFTGERSYGSCFISNGYGTYGSCFTSTGYGIYSCTFDGCTLTFSNLLYFIYSFILSLSFSSCCIILLEIQEFLSFAFLVMYITTAWSHLCFIFICSDCFFFFYSLDSEFEGNGCFSQYLQFEQSQLLLFLPLPLGAVGAGPWLFPRCFYARWKLLVL